MSSGLLLILVIVMILALLLSGQYIGIALATCGLILLIWALGGKEIIVAALMWDKVHSFAMIALPPFIFMGLLIQDK